jgi:hypothetical protein
MATQTTSTEGTCCTAAKGGAVARDEKAILSSVLSEG